MKVKFNCLIVVEGTSDISFLSSFIDADFIVTNGSAISKECIKFIKEAKTKGDVIILTDPDYPGKRIRSILDDNIDGLTHCYLQKDYCIKGNKVGVAQSDKNHVLECLNKCLVSNNNIKGNLTMNDLLSLGLANTSDAYEKKSILERKYSIGFCNAKNLLKRLNYLNIDKKELEGVLKNG